MAKKVKGYKCFNKDFTCNNFQFKVGKTFKHNGTIQLCKEGFHYCKELKDVFNYYGFDSDNHVCEIEASGQIIDGDDDKSVCSIMKVIRELPWSEVLKKANLGTNNLGFGNAGNRNAGHYNAGNDNAGHYNAGNRNAGHYNAGNDNAGMFNSKPGKLRLFNKETNVKFEDDRIQAVIRHQPDFQEYVYFSNMTDAEKGNHPYAKVTGGYIRQLGYKEGWLRFWDNSTDSVKKAFLNLPNFDKKVFLEITGIKV
jgi:hypothetical protein